ncbi:MAG: imidazolonepropionase [Actinobacteria bacterium]|nr:imidazolonepropionase [Actinomycetota bacterium]
MLALAGIPHLVTNDPSRGEGPLGIVRDAAIVAGDDGRVAWVGPSDEVGDHTDARPVDAGGRAVIPGFVDSHTHLVFAGDRAGEFAARMAGQPYAAGGIRTTMAATRAASDADLAANARRLAAEALRSGTTTLEVKSGYGLSVGDEARSLVAAGSVTGETTFLGAHVVPPGASADDYVDLVCGEMLAACAPHARWIDVFCDRGAFDVDQARRILEAGAAAGLGTRIHANQLQHGGAVRLGVELGAASCDHCTHLDDADVEALAGSDTVATLLPTAELCTRSPFPSARRLLDAGATVALASDCNPGSSYTTSMPLAVSLGVISMGMTCDEAVWAATAGGAKALRRDDVGVLRAGSRADFVVLDAASHVHLAYRPGVDLVAAVAREGAWVAGSVPA